jgi:hypothetical protein
MAQGIFYDGSTGNLIITASRVDISGSLSIQGISNVSSSIASGGGGGGGGSQNLQQVLDTGNTATQDIDLTGFIDADEYKFNGSSIITGSDATNISFGAAAGNGGQYSTALGFRALSNDAGTRNTAIGNDAAQFSLASSTIAIGDRAGEYYTGSNQTIIGSSAGRFSTSNQSVFIGSSAGENVGFIANIVAIGFQAARNLHSESIDADGTLAIGAKAGLNSSGSNTLIGGNAGENNQGTFNTFIGQQAGQSNTGGNNAGIGYLSLNSNTLGEHNVSIGSNNLQNNQGNYNVSFGRNAGKDNQGSNNLFVGQEAGENNTGNGNVFLGYRVGYNNSGDNNFAYGSQNLLNSTRDHSIAIGNAALKNQTTGQYNIALGRNAGANGATALTGQQNIFIGYNVTYGNSSGGILGAIGIGNSITLTQSYSIVLGRPTYTYMKVGIGTSTPTARLHIKSGFTTSAQMAFLVEDSNGTDLFKVTSDGRVGIPTSITPTGTSDSQGSQGDISYDDDYFYVKTSAGWKRAALSTWP